MEKCIVSAHWFSSHYYHAATTFTGVCLSTGGYIWSHVLFGGVSLPGPMSITGGVGTQGVEYSGGEYLPQDMEPARGEYLGGG